MDSSAEILARKLYYRMGEHGSYLPATSTISLGPRFTNPSHSRYPPPS
ncbi:MAG: hypothetical protein OXN97_12165 [Bryobacterales bacterium]|nr:hypothetical protein [Bryobacterales bacterium]